MTKHYTPARKLQNSLEKLNGQRDACMRDAREYRKIGGYHAQHMRTVVIMARNYNRQATEILAEIRRQGSPQQQTLM